MKPEEFVKQYYPFAKELEKESGVPAVFIVAQAAHESGWGEKAVGNNFFGIKAKKSTPIEQRQLIVTTEYSTSPNLKFPEIIAIVPQGKKFKYTVRDWFMKYETPKDSFRDHIRFLLEKKRYAHCMECRHDLGLFAETVARAGYATDPNYETVLKAMIKSVIKRLPHGI